MMVIEYDITEFAKRIVDMPEVYNKIIGRFPHPKRKQEYVPAAIKFLQELEEDIEIMHEGELTKIKIINK